MVGILAALNSCDFESHAPAGVDDVEISPTTKEQNTGRLLRETIENPRPTQFFLTVPPITNDRPNLFRFFIDGAIRITDAGFVVDSESRYLPILIAQIGVATSELDNLQFQVSQHDSNIALVFPDSFDFSDLKKAKTLTTTAARNSKLSLNLEFKKYKADDPDRTPMDVAKSVIIRQMREMELDQLHRLMRDHYSSRDFLVMIDGFFDYPTIVDGCHETFQNVVGITKCFNLQDRFFDEESSDSVGTVISKIPPAHRTPAYKIATGSHTIASWFLRIHDQRRLTRLASSDGVIQVQAFADSVHSISTRRCEEFSQQILALREPLTPYTDSRWASHLYPIYLTERYIISKFFKSQSIRACL